MKSKIHEFINNLKNKAMRKKTQTTTQKTMSIVLVVALFSTQSAFAQKQSMEVDTSSPMHNPFLLVSALLFIVGFTILFALKLRDDNKYHPKRNRGTQMPARHPNHYGRRQQSHR